ncbi:formylglycine-generating enzyme family protein [bacterium]|nr:formylglycine-generating enzyme family protein [bacterium]
MKNALYVSILTALLAGLALADNAASGLTSTQRWPWNGKVDIDFTLTKTTGKTTPVFSVKFFCKDDQGEIFELTHLEGEGTTGIILGDGSKRATWDAAAQLGTDVDSKNYEIGVFAEDVTEDATYLVLNLSSYKMTYSAAAPSTASGASSKYAELWLRRVEAGSFVMGSHNLEPGRNANFETEHTVTISKAFYAGVFELTEGQYDRINSGSAGTSCKPKGSIVYAGYRGSSYGQTWPANTDHRVDSTSFFGKLRAKTGYALTFDLPTDAQWEMACRDKGTDDRTTDGFWGSFRWNNGETFTNDQYSNAGNVAWYQGNADGAAHEVGLKAPSSIGTYDMHGNALEYCLDYFLSNLSSYTLDPVGPQHDQAEHNGDVYWRVLRSGNYGGQGSNIRAANRLRFDPATSNAAIGCRVFLLP